MRQLTRAGGEDDENDVQDRLSGKQTILTLS
jgi:hypothetical protein